MSQYIFSSSSSSEQTSKMSGQGNNNNGNDKKDNSGNDKPKKGKDIKLWIKDPQYWAPDILGLAECPPNRIQLHRNQRHPLVLNRQHPATQRTAKDAKFFKDRGAVQKPADGDQSKTKEQRCLTCINQGGSCHGTDVVEGQCRACRGIPVNAGNARRKRVCLWLDPDNNILTYAEAQRDAGTTRNERNQRPVMPPPITDMEMRAVLNAPGLLDLDPQSGEFETLSRLVASLWDAGRFTTNGNTNVVTIRDEALAERQRQTAGQPEQVVADSHIAAHLQTIIDATEAMLRREEPDEVLGPLVLLHLLPERHPGRNYGTRARGRGRIQDG